MGWVSQKAWGRMVGVGTIEGGGIMGVASASGAGGWGGELIAISAGGRLGGETHGNKYVRCFSQPIGWEKHRNKRGRAGGIVISPGRPVRVRVKHSPATRLF